MATDAFLSAALDTARAAAAAASRVAMQHFRRLDRVETKADGSPVTVADREAEAAMRAVIVRAFPDHAVLGEESGLDARGGGGGGGGPSGDRVRWILDPIDGTRGFSRGGAHWGPLVACEVGDGIVAAAMELPVLGRTYAAAKGRGCHRDGVRCRIGDRTDWSEATISVGELTRLLKSPRAAAWTELMASAACVRSYGDLAGCAMVLDGVADLWIEGGVSIWDVAAPRLLIEEAGGVFTDFAGVATHASGEALAGGAALRAFVAARLRAE